MTKNIIDIPIYSCSKEEYDLKYQEYISSFPDPKYIKSYCYPNWIWKYNNIIGYISVSLDTSKNDVIFDIYKHLGKIFILTSRRRPIQNILSDGWHFRVDKLSNREISAKTKEMVHEISSQFFKNRYVDLQMFKDRKSVV